MKKLMIVIFIFIILLVGNQNNNFCLLDYFSGEYTVYTSNVTGTDGVDLGFCYMNSKPIEGEIVGESIKIKNFEICDAIKILNAKVIKTEYLEDGTTVIYAFTDLISKKVKVANKHVNLQIATRDDITIIGWPLILGSY